MNKSKYVSFLILILIGILLGYVIGARRKVGVPIESESTDGAEEVNLVNYIAAGYPEQDVFVETEDMSKTVKRVSVEDANSEKVMESNLFATQKETLHDPFMLSSNPLGPYDKGKSLGITLADWLSAKGVGSYNVQGSEAIIVLNFENLIPNSVYSVWCSRMKPPPDPLFIDLPCGAIDGSQNSFKTDENGSAEFMLSMKPLEESVNNVSNLIEVIYHSDGKTHGASPGVYGVNSHVQLKYMLPALNN